MKWFTKRILLKSKSHMREALSSVLVGFVDNLRSEKRINRWYTSLKSDNGNPSFRVYLEIDESQEQSIQKELDAFLHHNADQIGWNGCYFSPDPEFDPSYPHLAEINLACELVLRVVKKYPHMNRITMPAFWGLVRAQVSSCLSSIDEQHHGPFIHFVANNFALMDDVFLENLVGN